MAARILLGLATPLGDNANAINAVIPLGNVAAGSLIAVQLRWESGDPTVSASDSAGVPAYNPGTDDFDTDVRWHIHKQHNSNVAVAIAYCWGHPGGTGVNLTVSFGGSNQSYRYGGGVILSGGDTTNPFMSGSVVGNGTGPLDLTVPLTGPGTVIAAQGNYSGTTYAAVNGSVAFTSSYAFGTYLLGVDAPSANPKNTGSSGSTASLALAFNDPAVDPDIPVAEGPLTKTDDTYTGYRIGGFEGNESVTKWRHRIDGGSWTEHALVSYIDITGRTHGDTETVEVQGGNDDGDWTDSLEIEAHVGWRIETIHALSFPQNGLGNTEIRMVMDAPPSRTSCTLIWKQKVGSQTNYYGGMMFAPNVPEYFDGGHWTVMFVQHGCDGTFNANGQRTAQQSTPIYEEIAGLTAGSGLSKDYIASPESIVGSGNQESYLVEFDEWYTKAATIETIGSTVRHTYYVDFERDPTKRIIQEVPLSTIDLDGDDPGLFFGTPPWIYGFNAGEAAYGKHRYFKAFGAVLDTSDILVEATSDSDDAVTAAGIASAHYSNINPVHTDIADKSGEGNDFEWTTANRPANYSEDIEVEVEAPALELEVNDLVHAHALDAVSLTTLQPLTVADLTHAHTLDAVTLTTSTTLAPGDLLHAQALDAVSLSTLGSLAVSDLLHTHALDGVVLNTQLGLTLADLVHAHSLESPSVNTALSLALADLLHGHALGVVAMSTGTALAPAGLTHAHTLDAVALSSLVVLTLADLLHAHALDNVALSTDDSASLNVADMLHAHLLESPTLVTEVGLTVARLVHSQSLEGVTLGAAVALVVADMLHAHALDAVTLSDVPALQVAGLAHAHTLDSVALSVLATLVVSDMLHAHRLDGVTLSGDDVETKRALLVQGRPRVWRVEGMRRVNA